MKFKRKVKIVNQRENNLDIAYFLDDEKHKDHFLNAIADAQNFEDIFVTCREYLKYGISGNVDRYGDYLKSHFYNTVGNKYFIYFFLED